MLKVLTLLIIILVEVSAVWAQPVPAEIKSTVGFIFVPNKKKIPVPNGTCFFVGVKVPQKDLSFLYAVTAKHVLEENPATHAFFKTIFIRVNTKDGQSRMLALDPSHDGPQQNVFLHNDPTVDLAVVRVHLDDEKDDFKFLGSDLILTKDDVSALKVTEGSEVFFTGLFTQHMGQQRNNPIVRFGRVALMTDEKIMWDRGQMAELYLVESASYGGNSGSPVFLFLGPERTPGQFFMNRLVKLAGVMKGSFGEWAPIQFVETAPKPFANQSMGIAAVVPAYKLNEILFSDEVKARRGF